MLVIAPRSEHAIENLQLVSGAPALVRSWQRGEKVSAKNSFNAEEILPLAMSTPSSHLAERAHAVSAMCNGMFAQDPEQGHQFWRTASQRERAEESSRQASPLPREIVLHDNHSARESLQSTANVQRCSCTDLCRVYLARNVANCTVRSFCKYYNQANL